MSLKILIVDDEPDILNLYARIFSEQDYSIMYAGSVTAAAALIKANHFDLLITELLFRDGLGTDLAQLFAKEFPGAKTLLVTGSRLEAGSFDLSAVSECLGKPLNIDKLMKAAANTLRKPRETDCCVLA